MNAQIRIGHFSPDAPAVNVLVDGDLTLEAVEFGTIADYMTLDAGSYDVEIVTADGGDAVLSTSLDLDAEMAYTVLATGMLADIDLTVMADELFSVDTGEARVRFVHLSPDAPAVDVVSGDLPLFENVAFADSVVKTVSIGSYDIDVRPTDSTDAVLSLSEVSFEDEMAYTVFAIGSAEADSLDAILVEDLIKTDADRKTATR